MELADIQALLTPLVETVAGISERLTGLEAIAPQVTQLAETVTQVKSKVAPDGPPDELAQVKTQLAELTGQLAAAQAATAAEKAQALKAQAETAILSQLANHKVLYPEQCRALLTNGAEIAGQPGAWTVGGKPLETAIADFLTTDLGKHMLPPATGGPGAQQPKDSTTPKTLDLSALVA